MEVQSRGMNVQPNEASDLGGRFQRISVHTSYHLIGKPLVNFQLIFMVLVVLLSKPRDP